MSLNWKEIQLILSEQDITSSKIQAVVQNSFHSITWELYSPQKGRYSYYTEVGTDLSRLHAITDPGKPTKTKKLQRFVQYARKNLEGSVITKVTQLPYDRCVIWDLDNHGRLLKVYIRLYSGPGANIIVTDENNKIQDLLLRRPGRDEISGQTLELETRTEEGPRKFEVRPYPSDTMSFNRYIETTSHQTQTDDTYESLHAQVSTLMENQLGHLEGSIKSATNTVELNSGYHQHKYYGDLLSSNLHLFKRTDSSVKVKDWNTGEDITITLDKSLSPAENAQAWYARYQKAQGSYNNAIEELQRLNEQYRQTEERFNRALTPTDDREADIRRLRRMLETTAAPVQDDTTPGIRCTSGGFQILCGRNAKENDDLLRHYAKGNDMWMHTRDFPGGYVFIKFRRDKTIPLDVLLDAANLAVLFSKGKNSPKVDLYYTQVRYLRRAKDAKTGLVLPTQEKNLTITPDRSRIARLLPKTT